MEFLISAISQTIPGLTITYEQVIVYVVGGMGALALMYAVLLEEEQRQDEVLVVGAASLLVYALVRNDNIVAFAMAGVMLIAGRELIQIMRGKHHHTTGDIQRYEHPESNT
jgi:lipid-A-disaccharide synthase-like uncharacterized protein